MNDCFAKGMLKEESLFDGVMQQVFWLDLAQ
jgi:hypothetical protein